MTTKRSTLFIKLDGLGDWIIFEYFLKQIQQTIEGADLLIESGCSEYIKGSVLNPSFSTVSSFNMRRNWVHSFFRRRNCYSIFEKIFVRTQLRNLSREYESVIVSVWNSSLERFIKNYLLSNLSCDRLFLPSQFGLDKYSCNLFRGEAEKLFLEAVFSTSLKPLVYSPINNKIRKIFIFANSFKEKKRWPEERYIQFSKWLLACGYNVSLWGLRCTKLPPNSFIKSGSIRELAEDLKTSDVYLGNDTGVMHLAVQMKKRVVIINNGVYPNSFINYGGNPLEILNGKDGKIETVTLEELQTFFKKNIL